MKDACEIVWYFEANSCFKEIYFLFDFEFQSYTNQKKISENIRANYK